MLPDREQDRWVPLLEEQEKEFQIAQVLRSVSSMHAG